MNASFTKITKKNLVSEATEQIRNFILSSGIRPDEKLPGELELASMLGISRPVIREALGRLQYVGLVESRKNRGTTIQKLNLVDLFETHLPFLTNDQTFQDELTEFRWILETGAIELAVSNASNDALAKIRDAAVAYKLKSEKKSTHEKMHSADTIFHIAILEAAGNKFLRDMNGVIVNHFRQHELVLHSRKHRQEVAMMHIKIAEAIMERNAITACSLMKKHLIPEVKK